MARDASKQAPQRIVIHMDLDYFFAQCEEREKPNLKGRPVVVCVFSGRTADSGVVSTANYVARRLGVKSGIPIVKAKKMLEGADATFIPVNHTLYNSVSKKVMDVVQTYADIFERRGIDECFLDVTERTAADYGEAESLAHQLKGEIREKEHLTCSLGIAPNKLVAKIASDYQKPDGLTIVKPNQVKDFLAPLPVGQLYGVGAKSEAELIHLGITTVEQLRRADPRSLVRTFRANFAEYLQKVATGIDEEPVQPREPSRQISKISTLKEDTRDLNSLLPELERLSLIVHQALLERRTTFRTVSVLAILEDLRLRTKSRTLDTPTIDLETINESVRSLLEALLSQYLGLKVRRVGIKLSGFGDESPQPTLTEFLQQS